MALWFETLLLLLAFFAVGLGLGYLIWGGNGHTA
jgi:hypothetical protein